MSLNTTAAVDLPGPAPAPRPRTARGGILLVGRPNCGKSVIFGLLTGRYVTVSNYPGTTVEIARGTAWVQGERFAVCDTPGMHTLLPLSQDERVTRDILLEAGPGDVVVQVADAKDLAGSLQLTLQLLETGLPLVLCLNMCDEAEERGIRIDAARLEARLGIPVVRTVAVRREGVRALLAAIRRARPGPILEQAPSLPLRYGARIESACAATEGLIPESGIARRALALMLLSGDDTLGEWFDRRVSRAARLRLQEIARGLAAVHPEPVAYLLNRTRAGGAQALAAEAQAVLGPRRPGWTRRLEPWTVHPVAGLPILGAVLYLLYLFVGVFGAGTCVDWIEGVAFGRWVNPAAVGLVRALVPFDLLRDLLVGPYGLITMALTYAIAIVLPIVTTFFLAFGILEDSGYFPRLAAMLNRLFRTMGLNGKAVLPMVLGLGCDTMATLTTRILETRKERATVIVLLAVGVPCSAQLAVIFALLGDLSWRALGIWLGVVAGILFLVGALAARILPGRGSDFVLELPPLRLPRPGNLVAKTAARVEWYLREAVPLFLLGTLLLFLLDRAGWLAGLRDGLAPVVTGLLGLPPETAEAFLLGFLRRDFGAAGLFRLHAQGRLDPIQTLVSVVTLTLFMPCVAQFFVTVKEKGLRFAAGLAAFTVALAVGAGAVLNLALRVLEVSLQ